MSQYGRPIGTNMVIYLQYWSPLGCYLRLEILLSDSGIFLKGPLDIPNLALRWGGGLLFVITPKF